MKYSTVKHIDTEIICPYCGREWTDSHEALSDGEETETLECPECDKKFEAYRCISIDYRTSQNCELNNEAHEWKDSFCMGSMVICKKCAMNKSKDHKEPKP